MTTAKGDPVAEAIARLRHDAVGFKPIGNRDLFALLDIADTLLWYARHADYSNCYGGEGHAGLDRGERARRALAALAAIPGEKTE